MKKTLLITTVYACCMGGAVMAPVALANDPCAGHDVVCGHDDNGPDSCSVCESGEGGRCWTETTEVVNATLPGCVSIAIDPLESFADLPKIVREKLPRQTRQPQFEISRPGVEVPTTREPQGGTPSTRDPQIPGTASTAGRS